jgi:tetratricopeptide (TPR) repeat protein
MVALGIPAAVLAGGCAGEETDSPPPASPAEVAARFDRARADLQAGRDWSGLWHLTRILHDDPRHVAALSGLGVLAYRQDRWEDVPTYLEPLAAVRPLEPDELLALADASNRLNRFAAAESLFIEFGRSRPAEAGVLVARGDARRNQGKLEAAAADYRQAIELDPRLDAARFALAGVLLDLNRAAEAKSVLARVPETTTAEPARLHLLRGRALVHPAGGSDFRKAAEELERCVEIEPDHVEALHLLMMARRELDDLDGARAAARRHREAAGNTSPAMLAVTALVQGAIAIEAGDVEAALAAWEKGLLEDPENLHLHCVLAPLYQELDRRPEARASFTVLRAAMSGAVPGPLFLATGKELRRRGLVRASVDQFAIAVDRMPESNEAGYFLALARSESGDWDGAIEAAARFEEP